MVDKKPRGFGLAQEGRGLDVVHYRGEIAFGIAQLSPAVRRQRVPYLHEFRGRRDSDQPIFLVIRKKSLGAFTAVSAAPQEVAFQTGDFVVLANRALATRTATRSK